MVKIVVTGNGLNVEVLKVLWDRLSTNLSSYSNHCISSFSPTGKQGLFFYSKTCLLNSVFHPNSKFILVSTNLGLVEISFRAVFSIEFR